ncbi:MAG: hypothetical protein ACE5FK_08895, partial [Candidatus Methylomirabilia bacterium]
MTCAGILPLPACYLQVIRPPGYNVVAPLEDRNTELCGLVGLLDVDLKEILERPDDVLAPVARRYPRLALFARLDDWSVHQPLHVFRALRRIRGIRLVTSRRILPLHELREALWDEGTLEQDLDAWLARHTSLGACPSNAAGRVGDATAP